ncbi:MAG: AzlD domain-containing protein, partial [Anaerolineales bacterium]
VMSRLALWGIILGGTLATYATRLSFIALVPLDRLSPVFRRGLRYVPPAVLAALILPALASPEGALELSLGNHRLLAGALAALAAWRFRNTWLTIAVGMAALWILQAI